MESDRPRRLLACASFALGPTAQAVAGTHLRHYYRFPGPRADEAVAEALTRPGALSDAVHAFAQAGCHELILFPCNPDPSQIDELSQACEAISEFTAVDAAVTPTALIGYLGGSPTPVRLEATTIEEENNMKFEMIAAATLSRAIEGKRVAALSHYQSKLHDAPPSLDNDGSAAR